MAGNNLYDFAGKLKSHSHLLTDEQIKSLELNIFLMKKAGEFLMKTVLNKNYKEGVDPIHKKTDNVLKCYDCDHIPKRKFYKLPKERLLVQVGWTSFN